MKKFFCEIDLFDFTSFFGLDFLKFSGPLCTSVFQFGIWKALDFDIMADDTSGKSCMCENFQFDTILRYFVADLEK